MKILIINAHLTYPGWSEGKLNLTFMDAAKAFFTERGQPKPGVPTVAETFVERGYKPEEEVEKHVTAGLVILQTPVNWFGAPWIYKKYVDEVFNAGLNSKVLLEGDGRTRKDPSKQYGTGGKMQGRKFMISATWNAPRETFDNPGSFLYAGKGAAAVQSVPHCGIRVNSWLKQALKDGRIRALSRRAAFRPLQRANDISRTISLWAYER